MLGIDPDFCLICHDEDAALNVKMKRDSFMRHSPLSSWNRRKLPSSSQGFIVSDIDWFYVNHATKRFMLCETKIKGAAVQDWQRKIFSVLNTHLVSGSSSYQYCGFHSIRFSRSCFHNGEVYFDNQVISEEDLIDRLSMAD